MSGPAHRVVLLGASNVRRGFAPLVETALSLAGGPIDLLAAMGHGRSYGAWSNIPGRALPGIARCGLWGALDERAPLPTTALLTDVGNDLLYGVEPPRLIEWVTACADRLLDAGARLVVTELPVASVSGVGEARYRFFRTLFFPPCRLTLAETTQRAEAINEALRRIAERPGAVIAPLLGDWYGIDPIHIKKSLYRAAWQKIFSPAFANNDAGGASRLALAARVRLSLAAPESRRLFGVLRGVEQPVVRLGDGTMVSLY